MLFRLPFHPTRTSSYFTPSSSLCPALFFYLLSCLLLPFLLSFPPFLISRFISSPLCMSLLILVFVLCSLFVNLLLSSLVFTFLSCLFSWMNKSPLLSSFHLLRSPVLWTDIYLSVHFSPFVSSPLHLSLVTVLFFSPLFISQLVSSFSIFFISSSRCMFLLICLFVHLFLSLLSVSSLDLIQQSNLLKTKRGQSTRKLFTLQVKAQPSVPLPCLTNVSSNAYPHVSPPAHTAPTLLLPFFVSPVRTPDTSIHYTARQ